MLERIRWLTMATLKKDAYLSREDENYLRKIMRRFLTVLLLLTAITAIIAIINRNNIVGYTCSGLFTTTVVIWATLQWFLNKMGEIIKEQEEEEKEEKSKKIFYELIEAIKDDNWRNRFKLINKEIALIIVNQGEMQLYYFPNYDSISIVCKGLPFSWNIYEFNVLDYFDFK